MAPDRPATRRRIWPGAALVAALIVATLLMPPPVAELSRRAILPLSDWVDAGLNWFAREGFPRGELGKLLALMQEIDHNGLGHLLDPLRRSKER